MSIKINSDLCTGCGECSKVCPGSLINIKNGTAVIPKPERCWGCVSCVKECPISAIKFFLGEDIGGLGGSMTVKQEGTLMHWIIQKPDGEIKTITVDSKEANKY